MTGLVQVDRIISEVNQLNEKDRMVLFRQMEELYSVADKTTEDDTSLQAVFGLWKDYDIDKTKLREKAWRKN